jgi:hypothetical protein
MGYGIWDMGYGIWDMGYGIWDMGYGIWDMGYGIWDMGYGIWDIGAEAPWARKIEDRRLELGTNPLHQPNRSLSRTKALENAK